MSIVAGATFNVAATLIVASVPPVLVANLSGEGLRIEWSIQKSRTSAADQATITVYNLAKVTREGLAASRKIPGPVYVSLAIGWGGVPELVFSGEAWKVEPERKTGTDVLSIIDAGEGAHGMRETPPSGGTEVGIGMQLAIASVLGKLGYVPSAAALATIAAKAADITFPIQFTGDGDLRDQLNDLLASIGLSWGIAGGRFVVFDKGARADLTAVVLNPNTGLVSWRPIDSGGVEFSALAQPRLEPGGPVTISNIYGKPIGEPVLRVDEITFQGSTGGPSMMNGTARPLQVT